MTTFYVGQRVRVVRSAKEIFPGKEFAKTGGPSSIGQEAVIVGRKEHTFNGNGGLFITVPSLGQFASVRRNGSPRWVFPEQLEPILPEGWKATDWDKCLWQPEGEIA